MFKVSADTQKILDSTTTRSSTKGVYGFFRGETCLYIGSSVNLKKRFTNHRDSANGGRYDSEFTRFLYCSGGEGLEWRILCQLTDKTERKTVLACEQAYIKQYKPCFNSGTASKKKVNWKRRIKK